MRNLKKIVSLALALMMVLSLMVTASAADFADADSINPAYEQAVEVMVAAGILNGTGNGFEPTKNLDRASAAKLVAYLATAGNIDDIVKCETVFTDVPATHWASGYIGYCYDAGVVNGNSATTYNPAGYITVESYAKLLLGVLGIEGTYTGDTWYVAVRNNAVKAKLMTGMTGYTWTANITREEAAQMTFNAMNYEAKSVETGKYVVKVNAGTQDSLLAMTDGMEFSTLLDAIVYMNTLGSNEWKVGTDYTVNAQKTTTSELLKAFNIEVTTVADGGKDDQGRPALVYTINKGTKNEVVLAYAEAPLAIYTSKMTEAEAKAADKALADLGYKVDTKITVWQNGKLDQNSKVEYVLQQRTGNNTVIELFATDKKVITTAVVTKTFIATAGEVTKANAEKKTPETIEINGEQIVNTTLGLKKGDVVTFNKLNDKINPETLAKAEYIVGTLSGWTSDGVYTINGKDYTLDLDANDKTVQGQYGKAYIYYLGANNTIIKTTAIDGTESETEFTMPTNYVVVKDSEIKYTVTATAADTFAGEISTKTINFSARVKVLHENGTVAIYNLPVTKAAKDIAGSSVKAGDYYTVINGEYEILLNAENAKNAEVSNEAITIASSNYLTANVYAYTVEDGNIALYALNDMAKDNKLTESTVLAGCTNGLAIKNNSIVVSDWYGTKVLVNADTKVVYEYTKSGKTVIEVSTLGESNGLPDGAHGMIVSADVTKNAKNEVVSTVYTAKVIYVKAAPVEETQVTYDNIAYVVSGYAFTGETVKVEGKDVKVYNYTAYTMDGSVVTLKSTDTTLGGALYNYSDNGVIGDKVDSSKYISGEYNAIAGTTITVGDNYLTLNDSTKIIEIGTNELKNGATVQVFVGKDNQTATVIFVTGAAK